MENKILYCKQCVMDSVGNPEFVLDENGVCNYCHEYRQKEKIRIKASGPSNKTLNDIVSKIKNSGRNKSYDCIIGVSGGVDSTYTAYKVKEFGLRPLAVHFDNGWNSELAVHNIQKTLEKLGIDLVTYVVDWEEFKDIQLSFLKASTPDGEIPSDHAIMATLYKMASKYGIKYIISGNNFKTEGIMPRLWAYGHIDWKYIRSVQKIFGLKRIRSFPHINITKFVWFTFLKRIKLLSILNYLNYDRAEAIETLQNSLGWQYYGGKHYESTYTKYYQGIVLPNKFNIDKRKIHLSAMILSGSISREDAQKELCNPVYPYKDINVDTEYVAKKFDMTAVEFDELMKKPTRTFFDYPNSHKTIDFLRNLLGILRKNRLYYS